MIYKYLKCFVLVLFLSGQPSAQDSIPSGNVPGPPTTDYSSNFVFCTVTDLFFGQVSFGYERTFQSGNYSLLIPLSFGIGSSEYDNSPPLAAVLPTGAYYFPNKIFSSGLELNYYP